MTTKTLKRSPARPKGSPKTPAAAKSCYCPDCNAWRLHQVFLKDGKRLMRCTVCDREGELPGLPCPSCGSAWLKVIYSRHPRNGLTIRTRECRNCQKRVRTAERFTQT
jgi:hypothetical protein